MLIFDHDRFELRNSTSFTRTSQPGGVLQAVMRAVTPGPVTWNVIWSLLSVEQFALVLTALKGFVLDRPQYGIDEGERELLTLNELRSRLINGNLTGDTLLCDAHTRNVAGSVREIAFRHHKLLNLYDPALSWAFVGVAGAFALSPLSTLFVLLLKSARLTLPMPVIVLLGLSWLPLMGLALSRLAPKGINIINAIIPWRTSDDLLLNLLYWVPGVNIILFCISLGLLLMIAWAVPIVMFGCVGLGAGIVAYQLHGRTAVRAADAKSDDTWVGQADTKSVRAVVAVILVGAVWSIVLLAGPPS